jgi:hypothetical protein
MSMKNQFRAAAALVGLLTLAAPAVSVAATAVTTQHYSTSMTELYGSPAPYSGSLDLKVDPSGIVSGYYFSADGTDLYVPVVGGQSGDHIWLDIGKSGSVHIEGRVQAHGVIVGTAFDKTNGQFSFVANPSSASAR